MKVLGIDNVFLPVGDLTQAVQFYQDLLGLPVAKRFDHMKTVLFQIGDETPGLGVVEADVETVAETVVETAVAGTAATAGQQKIWFEVADACGAADELVAAGVVLINAPMQIPTGWAVEVSDPWGNIIGLTDYTVRPDLGRA